MSRPEWTLARQQRRPCLAVAKKSSMALLVWITTTTGRSRSDHAQADARASPRIAVQHECSRLVGLAVEELGLDASAEL